MRSMVANEENPAASAFRAHSISVSPGVPGTGFGSPIPMSMSDPSASHSAPTAGYRGQQRHLVLRFQGSIPAHVLSVHHDRADGHDPVELRPELVRELIEQRADIGGVQLEQRGTGDLPKRREQPDLHGTTAAIAPEICRANDGV